MKYRPHRELLSESLEAQVEITTWEELVSLVANKSWHKNPVQISWKYEGYDSRCDWEDWNILVKEPQYTSPQYAGCTNEDPQKLIGCPGILPEAEYIPGPQNKNQKYQRGDKVRICRVGGPIWEGGEVYDIQPQKVGKLATVMGTYYDQFGGDENQKPSYTLKFDDETESSWYHEYQMEMENTEVPCTERARPATDSKSVKEFGKIIQDIDNQLMWGKPRNNGQ